MTRWPQAVLAALFVGLGASAAPRRAVAALTRQTAVSRLDARSAGRPFRKRKRVDKLLAGTRKPDQVSDASSPFTSSVGPEARSREAAPSTQPLDAASSSGAAPRLRASGPTLGVNGAQPLGPLVASLEPTPAQLALPPSLPVEPSTPPSAPRAEPEGPRAVRLSRPPTIDGVLDEELWATAPAIDDFTQLLPDEAQAPSQPWSVQVAYDNEALYFAFRMNDREPDGIVGRLTRRDTDSGSDILNIEIDTRGDGQAAYHFEVNAANVQGDAIRTGDDVFGYDWNAVWTSATGRTPDGWVAEVRIPLVVLRFEPGREAAWRFQFFRFLSRRAEWDMWAFKKVSEFGELKRFRAIPGIEGLVPSQGIEIRPFAVVRGRQRDAPPGLPDPRGRDVGAALGIDARFALTPGISLDATVLPDFGQIDADPARLNLSTYELFFPEKRPFFTERAELFSLQDLYGAPQSTQLFYSRRLGAPTPSAVVPESARLIEQAEVVRLWGAAKLTGSIGPGLTLALLDAVAAPEDATLGLADDARTLQAITPTSNFSVARLRGTWGPITLAGMVTDVHRFEPATGLGWEGECPNGVRADPQGRCTRDATTAALDLRVDLLNGMFSANAAAIGSRIHAGPELTLRDGTKISRGTLGYGGRLELAKPSGFWTARALFETFSPGLDLNEVGYLARQNLHKLNVETGLQVTNGKVYRGIRTRLGAYGSNSYDGVALSRGIELTNIIDYTNAWTTFVQLGWSPRVYDNRETSDGASTEKAAQLYANWSMNTDRARMVVFESAGTARTTWKGWLVDGTATLSLRPIDRLEIGLSPGVTRVVGDPRWLETVETGEEATWRYGLQDVLAGSLTLRTAIAFTTRLTLQTYAQLYLADIRYGQLYDVTQPGSRPALRLDALTPVEGDASPFSGAEVALNVNVVLRWEVMPGSMLTLAYTHGQLGAPPAEPSAPRLDYGALTRVPVSNVLMLKFASYFAQ